MLKVTNISTGYGKKQILHNISLEIADKSISLIVGSNGSGKSTLLKTIYGLLPVWNSGKIFFNGEDITRQPTSELLSKGLLYIQQKNNLFPNLTVKENIEIAGLTIRDKKILRERIDYTLSAFPSLIPHLKKNPSKISGGEKQLVCLAMAVIHKPKMIMLDEPFTGLSPYNIELIQQQIEELNKKEGVAFLIVEHRLKEACAISQQLIGLKLGTIFTIIKINSSFNLNELRPIFL